MNREILFRGKRINSGEWVYGSLIRSKSRKSYIAAINENPISISANDFWLINTPCYEVDTSTIGQFTGLFDKNGAKVFKGDKIKDVLTNAEYEVKFGFNQKLGFTGWYCESDFGRVLSLNGDEGSNTNRSIEVISNIHVGGVK